MLENIRDFHLEYNTYESIFLSSVIGLSIFLILQVITLFLGYVLGNLFKVIPIFTLLSTFLTSYFLLILIKPKFHIPRSKKLMVMLQFVFALLVIYVIL